MTEAETRADPDDVREALRLIRESGVLGEGKLLLLLDYLVTEELAGRGDRLKGYSIALDVFNRGSDFDPSIDSVVRVEMLRLRKALANYYALPQSDSHVVINLAKGSYRPTFTDAPGSAAGAEESEARDATRSFISVKRLVAAGALLAAFAALAIVVFGPFGAGNESSCSRPSLSLHLGEFSPTSETRLHGDFSEILQTYPLVLDGEAPKRCPAMQYRLALAPLANGKVQAALYHGNEKTPYWAEAFAADEGDAGLMMGKILYRVATPKGALVKAELRRNWRSDKDKKNYFCHVNSYSYVMNWESEDPVDDLVCLSAIKEENSPFSDTYSTYALLAQLRNLDPDNLRERDWNRRQIDYRDAIERALAINPTDCLALIVRLREYRRAGVHARGMLAEVVELAEQHCGDNPLMLEQIAMTSGFVFNEWEQSRRYMKRAIDISGFRHEYSHTFLGNLYFMGRFGEAHDKLESLAIEGMWPVIIGRRVGDREMAAAGMRNLRSLSIDSYDDLADYIDSLGYHPDVAEKFKAEFVGAFEKGSGG